MVNKRRLVCIAPVQAIVGKISKSKYKYDEERYGTDSSAVGFQNSWSPANRFRVVTSHKDKNSASQIAIRQKFAAVRALALDRMADPNKRAVDEKIWKSQTNYATFAGYIFHEEWLTYAG